jgi:hypothetical protein
MAQKVHGPEYNLRTEQIDPDVLMRVGGGKTARDMGSTELPTEQSTRRPLPLCLRCEQGARARVQPYDIGRIAHSIAYINSRLVLL